MDSRANLFESQNLREIESNANMEKNKDDFEVDVKKSQHPDQWDNPIEFLMTCIGYAVGIAGVIRFPYLCFENGGCAFVIAFLVMLFFFGVPLFFLELTISQYSKLGANKVWKVIPLFKGIGFCSVSINTYFCIYFNVLISYSVIYLVASFLPNIPWVGCDNWWNTENCRVENTQTFLNHSNATVLAAINSSVSNVSSVTYVEVKKKLVSASEEFFYRYVLEVSEGIEFPNGVNLKVLAALFVTWMLAFLSLLKGISSLGKISYFTAIFPYVMITALIIRGVTLPGAMKGLEFYILHVDMKKLLTMKTWIAASSQALFCLGIAQGGLLTLGRHNSFNYNHQKATFFIALLDGFTGVYAGFAIFSVLGFMAESTGQNIEELAKGGLGLSYIVYPEALSLMPFPWIWCIFFFMMMITIGFGSLLSMTECCLDCYSSILNIPKKHTTAMRFCTCMFFFVMGITMTTRGGFYLLNLIDNYTCTFPIVFLAALESLGLGWFYGVKRIGDNIRLMIDSELNLYWKICIKYVTPVLSLFTIVITFLSNSEYTLGPYVYPAWAHYTGYIIVASCLMPLFVEMFKQTYNAGVFAILWDLLQPSETWKPAFDDNSNSSESGSNEDVSSDIKKTKQKKNSPQYTSVKLQRITESKAQIIFQNDDEDEDDDE